MHGQSSYNVSWHCTIISPLSAFNQPCPFAANLTNTAVVHVSSHVLAANHTYKIAFAMTSADGRVSTASSLVTTLPPGSPLVSIPTKRVTFNSRAPLQLNGLFSANYSLIATWNVSFQGSPVSLGANAFLTPPYRYFTAKQASNPLTTYPLAVSPSALQPGRIYTFRLTLYNAKSMSTTSYQEVTLTASNIPSGGQITVLPNTGVALNTTFTASQYGWVNDVSNYPMTFDFLYQLTAKYVPGQPSYFTIVSASMSASVSFLLPVGLLTEAYRVRLIGRVTDINGATVNISSSVKVTSNNSSNPVAFLHRVLPSALASGDLDSVYRAIQLVSATLGEVDCSGAPNCTALHRVGCAGTLNTCGQCMDGYGGVMGDDNSMCRSQKVLASLAPVGANCTSSTTCRYQICDHGRCAAPNQTCPSTLVSQACSGHGTCTFQDSSFNTLHSCLITNTACSALCQCSGGYGGISCALTPTVLAEREATRVAMLDAVMATADNMEPSSKVLDLLVSTVYTVYDPSEVVTPAGIANSSNVLAKVAALSRAGYMKGTDDDTPTEYAETVNQFSQSIGLMAAVSAVAVEDPTPVIAKPRHPVHEFRPPHDRSRSLFTATAADKLAASQAAVTLASNVQVIIVVVTFPYLTSTFTVCSSSATSTPIDVYFSAILTPTVISYYSSFTLSTGCNGWSHDRYSEYNGRRTIPCVYHQLHRCQSTIDEYPVHRSHQRCVKSPTQ